MSKFKDYSLPELYGNTNLGPSNPAQINWKVVAVYGGIAIGTAIVFALIINHGTSAQMSQWQLHTDKMNQRYTEAIEKQEATIRMLRAQVAAGAKTQEPAQTVQLDNSAKS